MYQPNRTPAPATPILGDNYGHTGDPNWRWKLASTIYNVALKVVVIVAIATIFAVKTGTVNVGDAKVQGMWMEVASQVLNGVFMTMAMTNHPYYIVRLVMASRVLKANGERCGKQLGPSIRAARYLSKHFPLLFVHRMTIREDNHTDPFQAQCSRVKDTKTPAKPKEVSSRLGNFLFLRDDVKYLLKTLILLNCGCLTQYFMTLYMWSYNALARPGFVMSALLPPTILCNVIGAYRLKQLTKRGEGRRMILADGVPIFRELSSTRHAELSG